MTARRLTPRLGALAAALVVAACGGTGATSAPTQVAPPDAGPPIVIPTFDLGSFTPPSFVLPSFKGDAGLEALLPDSIGGQAVIKQSLSGEDFIRLGMGGASALGPMLEDLDASSDDLSVAIGTAGSVIMFAYRIEGVSADRVFDGFQQALPSGAGGTIREQTVAGRRVTEVAAAGETTYIYLAADVVFIIGGALTPELLEDTITQLPGA